MSQRAAWQLERYGFADVYDFVYGKAHWLASGRTTVRSSPVERVLDQLSTEVATADPAETVETALHRLDAFGHDIVIVLGQDRVVLGSVRASVLTEAAADSSVEEVMTIGPTTIRPHEQLDAVRRRMSERGVRSLIVTKTTGELIGLLEATPGNES